MSDKDKPTELEEILRKRIELDAIIDTRFKRPTTILYTDIVGSTAFFSTRGDIEGQLMIQRHNDLLLPLVAQHQGKLIKTMGDGLLVSFENPPGAVACAEHMQEALFRDRQGRSERNHIPIRIGIHTDLGLWMLAMYTGSSSTPLKGLSHWPLRDRSLSRRRFTIRSSRDATPFAHLSTRFRSKASKRILKFIN